MGQNGFPISPSPVNSGCLQRIGSSMLIYRTIKYCGWVYQLNTIRHFSLHKILYLSGLLLIPTPYLVAHPNHGLYKYLKALFFPQLKQQWKFLPGIPETSFVAYFQQFDVGIQELAFCVARGGGRRGISKLMGSFNHFSLTVYDR